MRLAGMQLQKVLVNVFYEITYNYKAGKTKLRKKRDSFTSFHLINILCKLALNVRNLAIQIGF